MGRKARDYWVFAALSFSLSLEGREGEFGGVS